jgi:3',5'-cyclic AMP phosphodiesterase CpdA
MKNLIQYSEIQDNQKYYWYQDNHNENNGIGFCTIENNNNQHYFYGTKQEHHNVMKFQ